ncbi:MAG: hypothetical protein A2Y23_00655 [Clostridiales bacterium GWB2_37_7]|nr:MAG: hypothetical protein A2Y23_00655 [Clostridiales bacterium GWB2_37_7]
MNCIFDKNIIQKYVDNTIDPLELVVLKEHIAVCRDCRFDLELMSKLENSMYEYFGSIPSSDLLDKFNIKVLETCYKQSNTKNKKRGIVKAWEVNKAIVSNAARCTAYIPGSKLAVNTAKKASDSINKAVKSYVKSSFRKLFTGMVK